MSTRTSPGQALLDLRSVLDAATEVSVIATDTDGIIRVFNRGAERMLGYRAAEMIGRETPVRIHAAEDLAARARDLTAELGRPVEGFEVFTVIPTRDGFEDREWTYVRKDGSRLDVRLVVTARRSPDGQLIGFLGVAHDMTGRKRAERELIHARDAAEAANRAKSAFLCNVSHELRTPLNGILGLTELALEAEANLVQRDRLRLVKDAAESLHRLVNDLLDFSKLDAAMFLLDPVPFPLHDELSRVLRPLAVSAHRKGLAFTYDLGFDVPRAVVGDPDRLRQVLTNLVGNAIKFTEIGGVTVRVRARPSSGELVELCVEVEDTGIGIPADRLDAVFKPFEQADVSMTRKYGGTGLGLSIAANLVELMGGRIEVASEVGKGSTFGFVVVVERAHELPTDSGPTPAVKPIRPLRLLVAEDSPINQRVAREILERAGHTVAVVGNGREAVAEVRRQAFDAVLMDVHMPEMDGFQATAAIRGWERGGGGPRLPILALTARAMPGDREECLRAGMDGQLTKPFLPAELYAAVADLVERQSEALGLAGDLDRPEEILMRVGGEMDLLRDVVAIYQEHAPRMLAGVRAALERGDPADVVQEAHKLVGLASTFSGRATEAVRLLENKGREGDLIGARDALGAVESAVERLGPALDALLKNAPPSDRTAEAASLRAE